jgi:hypothetical protein
MSRATPSESASKESAGGTAGSEARAYRSGPARGVDLRTNGDRLTALAAQRSRELLGRQPFPVHREYREQLERLQDPFLVVPYPAVRGPRATNGAARPRPVRGAVVFGGWRCMASPSYSRRSSGEERQA